jgi:hypothetical protein
MIGKIFWVVSVSVLLPTSVFGALPPYFQSSKEIIAILNNPSVSEKIGSGRPINSITQTESGYSIVARECSLDVQIHNLPQRDGMVGPVNFEIKTGDLRCNSLKENDLELERD